jgi:ATP-dependent Zn protease
MVMKYGFDAELGAENFAPDDVEGNYLGAETEGKAISDDTKKVIDTKVRDILQAAYATATHIITTHRVLHEHIADVLLQKEEMLKEDFDAFFVDVDEVPQKKTL